MGVDSPLPTGIVRNDPPGELSLDRFVISYGFDALWSMLSGPNTYSRFAESPCSGCGYLLCCALFLRGSTFL